ncbi:hypothetical protein BRC82_02495 [Halobacteriales archaeon QS_1_67_19]|nr:MAG: hypothetical protein BRC82_02495 [Halobacteriales archaeon QS_1_67_19]
MDSKLSEDDRRRIATFCETPPDERGPELLMPETEYTDEAPTDGESSRRASPVREAFAAVRDRYADRVGHLLDRR